MDRIKDKKMVHIGVERRFVENARMQTVEWPQGNFVVVPVFSPAPMNAV
jgi:hypothetical protein